jgi:hypothetical protein
LGFACGVFWHYRTTPREAPGSDPAGSSQLFDSTKAVLQALDAPVEIRFYALLSSSEETAPWRSYARRADQLLTSLQKEAAGKIRVTRFTSSTEAAAAAVAADGLRPIFPEATEASYVGMVVVRGEQRESLLPASPAWEPLLQSDLSRAIARVGGANGAASRADAPAIASSVVEEVRRLVPDSATLSLEAGTQILREKALAEFAATAQDLETQIQAAEQRFARAQEANSEAAQQAARTELLQLQRQRADQLKQLARRLMDQIAALEQIKKQ